MKLYFSPLACSLATRISLYEAGIDATFVNAKSAGDEFRAVSPLGLVPVLVTDDGQIVSENVAVLQRVARLRPEAGLAPSDPAQLSRLQQWLSFIATELHQGVFSPQFDKSAPESVKSYAVAKADKRLDWVEHELDARELLFDRFSVADAFLYTVLNWTLVTPIELSRWPRVAAFHARVAERPNVKRAFQEEMALYQAA